MLALRVFIKRLTTVMGPTPPGTGGHGTHLIFECGVVYVSGQAVATGAAGIVYPVDPHVDDDGTFLYHVGRNHLGNADGGNQDVRAQGVLL